MPLTPAEIRQLDFIESAYVLFVEGLPYAWVTDGGDALLGSGAGTWMGASEASAGLVSERTILRGLSVPNELSRGIVDVMTGMLQSTSTTFSVIDFDGVLVDLFAVEGRETNTLGQYIPPGTDPLGAAVLIQGGTTISPYGQYIGLEKIGPEGERLQYPAIPFELIGPEHAVQSASGDTLAVAPVLISEEPTEHTGRLVSLYRIDRDPTSAASDYTAWPLWGSQHSAGNLIWSGKLKDDGNYKGNREWAISCYGPESLLKKALGGRRTPWMSVASTDTSFTGQEEADELNNVAVEFNLQHAPPSGSTFIYGSIYHSQSLPASGTRLDYSQALHTIITQVADGTITAEYGSTNFADDHQQQIEVSDEGIIAIRRGIPDGYFYGTPEMVISMHERVWRLLGYDPAVQHDGGIVHETDKQIDFRRDVRAGFWVARISTWAVGDESEDAHDNYGEWRRYRPLYSHGVAILRSGVKFTTEDTIPYVEYDPLIQWSEQPQIDGQPPDGAALFVFRGKRAVGAFDQDTGLLLDVDDIEAEDYAQVARVSWRAGATYGSVYTEDDRPTFVLEEWLDPRLFGLPYAPLQGDWTTTGSEQYRAQCVPLNAVAYRSNSAGDQSLEESWRVLYTLLNSTGTTPGYTGPIESSPILVPGEQGAHDVLKYDNSLGIPSQLLSPPQFGAGNFREPFERVAPGGTGLSLGRYAWLGATQAEELIAGIIGARGLHISLRGGRFGVDVLRVVDQAEVDVEILESDLHGRAGDPRSTIPTVGIRATGQIDKIELDYAWNPIEASDSKKIVQEARDPGSRNRQGNLTHNVREPGLVDIAAFVDAGDLYPTPWEYQWRQWWAVDRASFYARRHFNPKDRLNLRPNHDLTLG